ncbi:MAG: ribonuclease III family protein [Planctomycetota bacterium]
MATETDNPILRPSERRACVGQALGHRFQDEELLRLACTHSSCLDAQANPAERVRRSNERLEFLGDTLLDAAIGEWLYDHYPAADEGTLSRYKSRLVSREILARAMEQGGLLRACMAGEKLQTPWPDSVKANFAESLLAAVYKDGGWSALRVAVERLLATHLAWVEELCARTDAKGRLQDWALKRHQQLPRYQTRRDGGSDHAPHFSCIVSIGTDSADGSGSSRRRAESDAARRLLQQLDQSGPG